MTEEEAKRHYGPKIAKWMLNECMYFYKKYKIWPPAEGMAFALGEFFEGRIDRKQTKILLEDMFQCAAKK